MNAALERYFQSPAHRDEIASLPLLRDLTARFADEVPLRGIRVVFGHVLARNSMVMVEALVRAGAEVVLTDAHDSPAAEPVLRDLAALGVPRRSVAEAVERGGVYLDVAAVLARVRPPRIAAEVTRSGTDYYAQLGIPVINADMSHSKLIEGFFGTGEAFLRAWRQLRPHDPPHGKRLTLIGYGKIGRGVAFRTRQAGLDVIVLDHSQEALERARANGFTAYGPANDRATRLALMDADIIVSVTGVKGACGRTFPGEWLRNGATLVNLGAEDEFGPDFDESEILGGKSFPLNFHLEQPTLNRYVDAPLAAHLLALEALILSPDRYGPGVHPLPPQLDEWIVRRWRSHHPHEDLTGVQAELGL